MRSLWYHIGRALAPQISYRLGKPSWGRLGASWGPLGTLHGASQGFHEGRENFRKIQDVAITSLGFVSGFISIRMCVYTRACTSALARVCARARPS